MNAILPGQIPRVTTSSLWSSFQLPTSQNEYRPISATARIRLSLLNQGQAAPAGNGYFYLTTMLVERRGLALEGNDGVNDTRMVAKGDFAGQLWKAIPAGDGYFYLTTMFVEGKGLVLEGNDGSNDARMVPRGDFTGQLWRAIPTS